MNERLSALWARMEEKGVDACLIPTGDFHASEYISEYFKARVYFTGFTGSAGTFVCTREKAGLWTDGRYFIQAERELAGSGVTLYREGAAGVPDVAQFLWEELTEGATLCFDGRTVPAKEAADLEKCLMKKGVRIRDDLDLAGEVWENRPALPKESAWLLEERYAGESVESKLSRIRKAMGEQEAGVHLLASLDDVAWTFNIRGGDIAYNPVALAYGAITLQEALLFIDETKVSREDRLKLEKSGVQLRGYEEIYAYAKGLTGETVLLDPGKTNCRLYGLAKEGNTLVEAYNPSMLLRAVKNETELDNLRRAHIQDGVAVTRFMFWLKNAVGTQPLTEVDAAEKLYEFRKEGEGFLGESFATIAAYGPNAAMMHYRATPESCAALAPEGLLLVDSGGHYLTGTTDITRTFALGPVSEEIRLHYTATLRSMLRLAGAKFLAGCTGRNLDILARGPIWDLDLDYRCGTGHGVGYLLSVHEGPNGFRWRSFPGRIDGAVFVPGMVTTDEPGIYIEGSHGVRIENELVCREGANGEYGQFLCFETITLAPIDLDAVDLSLLSRQERVWLNDYHQKVYDTLAPLLTLEEACWLAGVTRPVDLN